MSYTPTEWKTGDVVTAEKLNKIEAGISENGSGSGGSDWFVVNFTAPFSEAGEQTTGSTEVTPRQVMEAVQNNKNILLKRTSSNTTNGLTTTSYLELVPVVMFQYDDNNFMGMMSATAQVEIGAKLFVAFQGQNLDTPYEVITMTITDNNSGS